MSDSKENEKEKSKKEYNEEQQLDSDSSDLESSDESPKRRKRRRRRRRRRLKSYFDDSSDDDSVYVVNAYDPYYDPWSPVSPLFSPLLSPTISAPAQILQGNTQAPNTSTMVPTNSVNANNMTAVGGIKKHFKYLMKNVKIDKKSDNGIFKPINICKKK